MSTAPERNHTLLYRTLLALIMVVVAAALRVAPHPWNFTPIGAMALFSGALVKDRRLGFAFPLLALFVGDLFVGFYNFRVMVAVYLSFLVTVGMGFLLRERRSVARISAVTLAGAIQFFVITNLAWWWFGGTYAHTRKALLACYIAGIPLFWNTLAGDAFYAALLFGGFAVAERVFPPLRQPKAQAFTPGQALS